MTRLSPLWLVMMRRLRPERMVRDVGYYTVRLFDTLAPSPPPERPARARQPASQGGVADAVMERGERLDALSATLMAK